MKFRSTRGQSEPHFLGPAILRGLAPDGGLYVPERWPEWDWRDFDPDASLGETACRLLTPFAEGDPLAESLAEVCSSAMNFPIPRRPLAERVSLLELFHGPTAAFKDVGARFLASAMSHMSSLKQGEARRPLTILVATSGDTGGAIAAAFHRREGVQVGILFPDGGVSPLQRQQLTCWGDNVRSFAVRGTFDDCQKLVKAAFADEEWRARVRLTSANSINIGRLLPQMVYYVAASIVYASQHGSSAKFVIPSGNVGNACAALWARRMGFPIDGVMLATNRNRTVTDFLETGEWRPRDSVATPANAMDVGNPSNMERIVDLYRTAEARSEAFDACWVDDEALLENIKWAHETWGVEVCPHTAAGVAAYRRSLPADAILVATAHPAKFRETVEPVLGHSVELPNVLQSLMGRDATSEALEPDLKALQLAMG